MSASKFMDEFKRDAVAQVVDRGYSVREVADANIACRATDECLNDEIFDSLADALRTLALWRHDDNNVRLRPSLGNLTPAEARRALEQTGCAAPGALAQPEASKYQTQGLWL